jgi:hypothetical protein
VEVGVRLRFFAFGLSTQNLLSFVDVSLSSPGVTLVFFAVLRSQSPSSTAGTLVFVFFFAGGAFAFRPFHLNLLFLRSLSSKPAFFSLCSFAQRR